MSFLLLYTMDKLTKCTISIPLVFSEGRLILVGGGVGGGFGGDWVVVVLELR